ncbi:serine protease filzig-like [Artemia franciscana]|uniref:Peptidase S1 domain-containing protein n=1 Tax=Artemia franciscana TaxID=6661 RepID=A0AA88LEA0_ARTSF|nr:hypothetical protein QYM36_003756 [Artemia franciscana]KAK2721570.1 hypothetical protein QYM36_003756 [Artemia franciscana]KAK2721571.1 hypothetical protein QYM36_003756 [Artemia franciscana]KAK2721572.1 hypothetical protein QYM36_003756 [Artemia franciscana]
MICHFWAFPVAIWISFAKLSLCSPIGDYIAVQEGQERSSRYLKIKPKSCKGPEGNWGVCMFNYECTRLKGTVLATCVDGFLFGACCQTDVDAAIAVIVSSTANVAKPPLADTTEPPEIDNILSGAVSPQDIEQLQKKFLTLHATGNLFTSHLHSESEGTILGMQNNAESGAMNATEVQNEANALSNEVKYGELNSVNFTEALVNTNTVTFSTATVLTTMTNPYLSENYNSTSSTGLIKMTPVPSINNESIDIKTVNLSNDHSLYPNQDNFLAPSAEEENVLQASVNSTAYPSLATESDDNPPFLSTPKVEKQMISTTTSPTSTVQTKLTKLPVRLPNLTPEQVSTWKGGLITWTIPSDSTHTTPLTWTVKIPAKLHTQIDNDIGTISDNKIGSDKIPVPIIAEYDSQFVGGLNHSVKSPSTEYSVNKGTDTIKPADLLQYLVSNPPKWVVEELLSDLTGLENDQPEAVLDNQLIRDSKLTTTTSSTTTTTTTTTTSAPKRKLDYRTDCGVQPLVPQGRIVGGKQASYGRFPWQVLIRESSWFGIFTKNKCGGVLIADKWVISAAHCQPGFLSQLVVLLGEHDISNKGNKISTETRNVKRVIRHKDYVEKTFENDLALLELETPITRKPNIVPICLPPEGVGSFVSKSAIVSGWGKLSVSGPTPTVLQEVDVPIMTNSECHDMFQKAGHTKKVLDSFLCAGYPEGLKDSCEGDSGGPLQMKSEDGRWILVGTVSHGIKCAYPNLPGVYMRMTYYKPWISRVTGTHFP